MRTCAGIEFDHAAFGVLADDGEEVQQATDVLLAHAWVARGVRVEVVGEGVEDRQGALGGEVEDVGVLLLEDGPAALERARVLRTERGLHVQRGRGDVREHDDGGPLGHGDACGELTDGQCDRLAVMLFGLADGSADLVQRLADDRQVCVVGSAVACGEDDRVVLEHRVLLQDAFERLGGGDTVQEPERVADLVAQLGRGERVLLVGGQAIEELDDLGLVLEEAVVLGGEELTQVEGVVDVGAVLVDGDAHGELVADHARDLVGEHVQRR